MQNDYRHLTITRETLENPRRTRNGPLFVKREDLRAHGKRLNAYFKNARQAAQAQYASQAGKFVFKLRYEGALTFENLSVHGVEFVSQEDRQVCVVFADERGMMRFSDHLSRLGIEDQDITYKQILEALDGIENWTEADRTSWAIQKKGLPSEPKFKLDVELWPISSASHPERNKLCRAFEQWLDEQKVAKLDRLNLDSLLMYRVQVTHSQAIKLLNHLDVRLVDLPPTTGIDYHSQLNRDINSIPNSIPSPSLDAAKICILDSGINTNHPLLRPAIAESASFLTDEDVFDQNGHGTAVAGIALYGDLEACNASNYWRPEVWLYSGKILDSNGEFDEKAIERTLATAVKYFAELGCRIFNLSVGNANAPYDGKHIRGMAYLLDKLTRQYNVVFIVSAGNFRGSDDPPVPAKSWREEYPEYLVHQESSIIDPGPALNVITVGSLARHDATKDAQLRDTDISQLCPAKENQPSPFTRHGPTIKGALKPEVVAHGGNSASQMRQEGKQWQRTESRLGVLTCNHEFVGKTLFTEQSGTSFSTPYVTHLAGRFLNQYPKASANLIRAMLVNHASMPTEVESAFSEDFCKAYKKDPATLNREVARDVAGYGLISEDILFRSTENAVVLMIEDTIEDDSHQFFEIPVPPDFLRKKLATRELRISLAFSPEVRTTRFEYLATRINFRFVRGKNIQEVAKHFNHDTQDSEESRNDDATNNRSITAQTRDKGTVQCSTWQFRRCNPENKWFVVVTRQDRPWGKALSLEQESYALVVTVTDRDNEDAVLYTQIQERIRTKDRLRNRG